MFLVLFVYRLYLTNLIYCNFFITLKVFTIMIVLLIDFIDFEPIDIEMLLIDFDVFVLTTVIFT